MGVQRVLLSTPNHVVLAAVEGNVMEQIRYWKSVDLGMHWKGVTQRSSVLS